MLQSHTATQQWQSFEFRMRRRRVERCLLRASVALEAGVLDDVRTALEEVQRLDPHEPELRALTAQLAVADATLEQPVSLETPAVAAPSGSVSFFAPAAALAEVPLVQASLPDEPIADEAEKPRRHALAYAMAVLLIAASGAAGWFYVATRRPAAPAIVRSNQPAPPHAETQPSNTAPAAAPAVRVSETAVAATQAAEAAPAEPAPAETTPAATAGADSAAAAAATAMPRTPESVRTEAPPPTRASESPAARTSPPVAPLPAPATVVERPRALEPSPTLPDPPAAAAPVAVAGADGVALTDTSVTLTPPAVPASPPMTPPSPPAPAAAAPQNDERLVRAALGRYEAAYSALDAAAASRVWPGVDQRALASAFQGLESQSVSLGRCDVRLAGATAQADCKGTARWNPKVGGGPQTAARQWRFDLRNTGGDWIITRATVR